MKELHELEPTAIFGNARTDVSVQICTLSYNLGLLYKVCTSPICTQADISLELVEVS